jgi:hypothetical protein
MKRFMLTVAMTCVLSVSALAGEMPTCGVVSNLLPPATTSTTIPGEMPTTGETQNEPGNTQEPGILVTIIVGLITWP